jgi:tetratricopeptide (TPR) repeat protein
MRFSGRPSPRQWLWLAAVACLALGTRPGSAQVPVVAPEATQGAEEAAHEHFRRALELYRSGQYALALSELKRAADLDPSGKDLFFNLALVHEKLAQLPEAIEALERFRALESDATEREKAAVTIERLQGALAAQADVAPAPTPCAPVAPLKARPETTINPVVIGAASVSVVALVVGGIFGIKALSDDVGNTGTSATSSITQLRERGRRAERAALVADVALAISAAAGGTALGVWLLESHVAARRGALITLRSEF